MSSERNIIEVYFKGTHLVYSKTQYQYNHGMILHFADLNLPQAFEAHFANKQHGISKTVIGSENKVEIPDEYFWSGANEIYAWVYLHSNVDDGETVYEVRIPLVKRAKPTDEEPLPEQESTINRAIAELNHAVEQTSADAEQTSADREAVTALRDEVIDLKDEAEQSAQTATAKANEASESANSASESEQNTHDYANDAKRYAENAFSSKEIAVANASDAEQAKEDAEQARDDAQDAKSDAIQIKQDIVGLKDDVVNLKDDVIDLKEQTDTNVTHYPKIIDEYWHVWDAGLGQFVNTNIKAQGEDGTSPYILSAWFDTIFIPCDENGVCTKTLTTSVRFYAFHGEDPIPCTVLEETSEQNPLVDKNLRLWLVRPSTSSSVGIFSVAYTSGTDPFDGLEYDTYRENLIFTLDNGVTTRRHGFTLVKVKQGITGDKGDIGGLKTVKDDPNDGGTLIGAVDGVSANSAIGYCSLAQGLATISSGNYSHAEGVATESAGLYSHSEGWHTRTAKRSQHVMGEYNVIDEGTNASNANERGEYALIIGNGTSDNNRSNALGIKWDGTFVFANGTEITPAQFTSLLNLLA